MQFWDKYSFVDGPIRSVLHMIEKEYPFQISELIRFLSAVCHGTWPAHCVYVILLSLFFLHVWESMLFSQLKICVLPILCCFGFALYCYCVIWFTQTNRT